MESRHAFVGRSDFHWQLVQVPRRYLWFFALICFPLLAQSHSFAMDTSGDAGLSRGRLMLLGGGKMPPEIRNLFFQLAGAENARIVLIPTGSQDAESPEFIENFLEPWRQYSPQSIVVLHARDRCQANDPDFLRPLREATAVWIGGGVQSRLADRYVGTEVETELQNLLGRDGIIAGTSAGAAVMTRVMIADGLKQPVIATGLDLFKGAIVDQHFTQRYRMARLIRAVQMHPGRIGVGIDEGTGLLVQSNGGQVLGKGRVRLIVAMQGSNSSALPLLVRDYNSGETVSLDLWCEATAKTMQTELVGHAASHVALEMQSRIAPSLTYSFTPDASVITKNR